MQGKEIFKEQESAELTEQQILKLGKLYEAGTKAEWFEKLIQYSGRKLSQVCSELIFGDQGTLQEVYFLKGQIIGILDIRGHPDKTIARRKQIIEEREERAKKKKEKEKRSAGR